jgi:hypothetical protein
MDKYLDFWSQHDEAFVQVPSFSFGSLLCSGEVYFMGYHVAIDNPVMFYFS